MLAARLGRSPSAISREVNANVPHGKYRTWYANVRILRCMVRLGALKLVGNTHRISVLNLLLTSSWPLQSLHGIVGQVVSDE